MLKEPSGGILRARWKTPRKPDSVNPLEQSLYEFTDTDQYVQKLHRLVPDGVQELKEVDIYPLNPHPTPPIAKPEAISNCYHLHLKIWFPPRDNLWGNKLHLRGRFKSWSRWPR